MADPIPQLLPLDDSNRELESNVHPRHWKNPTPTDPYHLVIIGAGTAGLVTAAGAAGLGARVALIERELMGGDCLNVGCVPSKGVLRAARVAATVRESEDFGIHIRAGFDFDFARAMARMRALRARISPADSARRFTELGVDVFFGQGSFIDSNTVSVRSGDGTVTPLKFKKAVIASGARAAAPPIDGLDSVNYLTNETLFSLTELPSRLGVVGAGPVGSEMAQSFARFGSEVFLFVHGDQILPREESDAALIVQKQFEKDGVTLMLGSHGMRLDPDREGVRVRGKQEPGGCPYNVVVDQILIAAGRAPNTSGLNLEAVGVEFDSHGVKVDDHLQTTNPRIFAAGDICSQFRFTHAADFQARIVIQNSLFALGPVGRKKVSKLIVPWATYTSPEIAHVGMYAADAADAGIAVETYVQHLEHVDRAILDGNDAGFVKVLTKKGTDQIVGATIVAENAGDLISEITVAMTNGLGLSNLGRTIHPYPTQADAIRRLGDQFNKTKLTPWSQKILSTLMRLNVGK